MNIRNTESFNTVRSFYWTVRSVVNLIYYSLADHNVSYPAISFMSNKDAVDEIVKEGRSMARFGDGEFTWMLGYESCSGYQLVSKDLSARLSEVLHSDDERLVVGVLKVLNDDSPFTFRARAFWKEFKHKKQAQIMEQLDLGKTYADSSITRPYIDLKDKSGARLEFENLKRIWEKRNILLVEGRESRLGVGNDLFDNAASLHRLLGPSTNAFSHYDAILERALQLAGAYDCILLALGPTATVLAYDLCRAGYQAVDIGHIDNEYEWMKMGAKRKTSIEGKNVDEVGTCANAEVSDERYLRSIVGVID